MRKRVYSGVIYLSLICFLSTLVVAQEVPKIEMFGGYSHLRFDNGPTVQLSSDVFGGASTGLNGWNAQVAVNANPWAGLLVDFSGHYASDTRTFPKTSIDLVRVTQDRSVHNFLVGPQFSLRRARFTISGHALLGVLRFNESITPIFDPPQTGISSSSVTQTKFAGAFGGSFDINVKDCIAIRPVQLDYIPARLEGSTRNNVRLSTGVVFRIGRK